jgi:hypothetical protein
MTAARTATRTATTIRTAAAAFAVAAVGLGVAVLHPAASQAAGTTCSAAPSACGYPDATNTGVPSSVKLTTVGTGAGQVSSGTGWTLNAGGWVQVTGAGAMLSGLYIPYNVNIVANNVTLNDDKIVAGGPNSMGVSLRHTSGATVENTTIAGTDSGANRLMTAIKDVFSDSTGLTVNHCNISNFETGVQVEAGLVENNYIHNPGYVSGDHTNGVMSNGDNTPLAITHNTIFNSLGQTDDIGLFEDFSGQANRTITNNLLGGGAYSIYAGATNETSYGVPTHIVITGNVFATNYFSTGGAYGPVAYYDHAGTGNTWSSNTWDGTGTTIPSP